MSALQTITVGGAPEGFDARLLLDELRKTGSVTHVARDDKRMNAMAEALAFLAPDVPVFTLPGWDCLPYDRVSPNADISATRMATLAALAHGLPDGFILLTTVNAATQRLPARALLKEAAFTARTDDRVDEAALRAFLVRMGFVQAPTVTEPGDYAIRGGIIDIFPPGDGGPVRLDFFGDVLEGARRFDPVSQRTTEALEVVELAPVSEVILDEPAITRFRQSYRLEFGAAGTDDPLYEAVSAGRKHAGIEPAPPDALYFDEAAWDTALAGKRVLQFAVLPMPTGPGVVDAGGRVGREFAPERQQESVSLFDALADHIKARSKAGPVLMASYSDGARERLQGLLEDSGIEGARPVSTFRDVGETGVYLSVWSLEHGFETRDGLTVISEQDVLGDRLIRQPKKKRRADNFLTETQSLSPGDLIVHVDHGVGRYMGLEVVEALGAPHECIHLEYAGGDRLFLPVENIELLSRYGHEEGLLDRLGGGAWQAKKAKLKERIRLIAEKLIRVAAERHLRKAPVLDTVPGAWDSFSARFPYQETDDQLKAITVGSRSLSPRVSRICRNWKTG